MPETIQDHASGRRYPPREDAVELNKLRQQKGERDPRPAVGPPGRPPAAPVGEGGQHEPYPGQAELFPAPAGSDPKQGLLF